MNIWIFNPFDPLPGEGLGELRYARLAKALVAQGHDVLWWSVDWSHNLKRRRVIKGAKAITSEATKGGRLTALEMPACSDAHQGALRIALLPVPAYQKNISLRRVWSHRCYAKRIAMNAEAGVAQQGQPDVILFSVPPMEAGAVALELGKCYDARVVLDVMDAWPEALQKMLVSVLSDGGRGIAGALVGSAARIVLWPYVRMMRRYCGQVDAVCAQSRAFSDYARAFGAAGAPPVFYLGASSRRKEGRSGAANIAASEVGHLGEAGGANPPDVLPLRVHSNGTLRLLYLGSMGRVYDLRTLVEAVLRLLDQGAAIRLDVVGEGEQRTDLEAQVASAGRSEAIAFHGYLKGEALNEVMAGSDVGVVPMYLESAVAIPYKVCDYLAAGLPVINSLPGELQTKLEDSGCGQFYEAGDTASLIRAMRPWLEDAHALEAAKASAWGLFKEQFDADLIYPKMAAWLTAN